MFIFTFASANTQSVLASTESSERIFCLGDSITFGYIPSGQLTNPYPSLLSNLTGLETVNGGVNGATTSEMLSTNSTWATENYTTLVLMGGINDVMNGLSTSSIENNLLLMWQIALGDDMTVYTLTILPTYQLNATQNEVLASVNSWIKSTAPTIDVTVVDTHTLLEASGNPTVLNPTYDSGDGVHPNQAGANVIANAIYQAILNNRLYSQSSMILTNEGNHGITALINANYGSSNLYQTLVAIVNNANPSISSIITTSFMSKLASCPGSSQIFTSKLEDYATSSSIAISSDGTVQAVNINGSTYLNTQGTSNLTFTVSGAGTFNVCYNSSSTPLASWNVTSGLDTTTYKVCAILWFPIEANNTNTSTTAPTTTDNPPDYTLPIIIAAVVIIIAIPAVMFIKKRTTSRP